MKNILRLIAIATIPALFAVFWMLSPAAADANETTTTCIDNLVHVNVNYVNNDNYTQWVEISLNDSDYAGIMLSPGDSIPTLSLNTPTTNGGEFVLSVSNSEDPYDGIQMIRVPFGPDDCSPPATTTTTTMVPTVSDSEDALEPPSTTTPVTVTKKVVPKEPKFTG
jgi:hypothetical protein